DLKILVIDDDPFMHEVIQELVGDAFATIDHANDGAEALEIFKKNRDKYDFIMTDIQMPNMNGVEFVGKVRALDDEIPLIVASAHDDANYLIELINYGVDYFFSKPIGMSTIPDLIKVCANVVNVKVIREYQIMLEESQAELERQNQELQAALKKLSEVENKNTLLVEAVKDNKQYSEDEIVYLKEKSNTMDAEEFHAHYPTDLESKNTNMENIEEKLDITISKILTNPSVDTFQSIGYLFNTYADNILLISEFSNIGVAIQKMAETFYEIESLDNPALVEEILYSISRNIEKWRISIFVAKDADDIHYLDNSLIGDCMQVDMMIKPKEDSAEDTSGDIDFF
ncbi:MAG: response regulator, partial [Campylobacterales bacterium]|nr:response regulator [Campylobacterales bacterium]